jgi:hypothetical protein
MAGMTGNVPYYGGRFTPAQAYAASHRMPPPPPSPPAPPPGPTPAPAPSAAAVARTDPLEALEHLREAGVVSPEEYERLRARITP